MTAAIRNNYSIVKILHGDGYRIFEKLADDRFFFSEGILKSKHQYLVVLWFIEEPIVPYTLFCSSCYCNF